MSPTQLLGIALIAPLTAFVIVCLLHVWFKSFIEGLEGTIWVVVTMLLVSLALLIGGK